MTKDKEPLLSIRLQGDSIGEARMSLSRLLRLLENVRKALLRSAQIHQGDEDSTRKGPKTKGTKELMELDVIGFTHGSPAVVVQLDRSAAQQDLFGRQVIEKSLEGLETIQQTSGAPPAGFDRGVLLAWRDVGRLFDNGVDDIRFTLNHRPTPKIVHFSPAGYQRIRDRITGPDETIRTIEGRLLMADFKEHGTRCRVHPSVGDPVLCLFDEEQKDEVLENILHFVRVEGDAKEDPVSGKITSIRIKNIEPLEDREEGAELLPQGSPIPHDFWESPTIEELAASQGVKEIGNIEALFGTWPGDLDDDFETEVRALRQTSLNGGEKW